MPIDLYSVSLATGQASLPSPFIASYAAGYCVHIHTDPVSAMLPIRYYARWSNSPAFAPVRNAAISARV
jgi:hypothetical protein